MPLAPDSSSSETAVSSQDDASVRKLFHRAIQSFEEEASPKEKDWLRKAYKHEENKPPDELESFRTYLLTYDRGLKNGKLKRLYDRLSSSEGLIRGFGIIVDAGLKFLPEPYSSPVTLVFGVIKFAFRAAADHVENMEKIADDLTWILEKLSEVQWWVGDFQQIQRVSDSALKVYVAILKYWCEAWDMIKEHKSFKTKVSNLFKNHDDSFAGLQKEIERRMAHLTRAAEASGFVALLSEAEEQILRAKLQGLKETFLPGNDKVAAESYNKWKTRSLRLRFPGTCQWIHEEPEFQNWLAKPDSNRSSLLWIHAIPGAGKSVMASYVINHILNRTEPDSKEDTTLFFFCRHDNMAQRSVEEVIKSLLLQIARRYCLCPQLGRVDRTILALLEAITADDLCNIEDAALDNPIRLKFEKVLSELRSRGTVRIVIDGLDELENYQACRILSVLSGVSSTHRSLAAVLVFSRKERFLETEFDDNSLETPYTGISLPGPRLLDDLWLFSAARLGPKFQKVLPDEDEKERSQHMEDVITLLLRTEINNDAPPFLWVSQMMVNLEECNTLEGMKSLFSVPYLPDALYSAYARTMVRIEMTTSDKDLALLSHVLSWMTCGFENVKISQLLALAPSWGPETMNLTAEELRDKIQGSCATLLVVRKNGSNRADDTLHFLHYSMKEFLTQSKPIIMEECQKFEIFHDGSWPRKVFRGVLIADATDAHRRIFFDCLSYLTETKDTKDNCIFQKPLVGFRGDPVIASDISSEYPLLEYAAKFWPLHMVNTKDSSPASVRLELDRFFGLKQCHSWMEAAMTFYDGIHWLLMQKAMIQEWLDDPRHAGPPCDNFDSWANDISSHGFRNYEVTLRYNPNDIHFLDSKLIFGNLFRSKGYVQEGRDCVVCLTLKDGPSKGQTASPKHEASDNQPWLQIDDLVLPSHLDLGEYNNEYGLVAFDNGRSLRRGLFLIDRFANHPRLLWIYPSNKQLGDGRSVREMTMMERKIMGIKKNNYHKLWTMMSSSLHFDGTRLAAFFGERVEATADTPAIVKTVLIIWEFQCLDDKALRQWKADLKAARLRFRRAVESVLHGGSGTGTGGPGIADELEGARRQLSLVMDARPAVPTATLFISNKWATVWKVFKDTDDFVETPVLLASRYLLAFKDENTLVTPRGLYSLSVAGYLARYPRPRFTVQLVIVPTGDGIFTFADPTNAVLEFRSPMDFKARRSVAAKDLGDHYDHFGAIVDCSQTGRLVCLTLVAARTGCLDLVILDRLEWTFKILMSSQCDESGFKIQRAFFCPRDMHMVVACERKIVQWRTEMYVVDIPRGKCQFLEYADAVPNAVLCTRCGYSERQYETGGAPLPLRPVENDSAAEPAFVDCLYSFHGNERLGIVLAELRLKRKTAQQDPTNGLGFGAVTSNADLMDDDWADEDEEDTGGPQCGCVGIVEANRNVHLKSVSLAASAFQNKPPSDSYATENLTLHRTFHRISPSGLRVASGSMAVSTGARLRTHDTHDDRLDSSLLHVLRVAIDIRCATWLLDPSNCHDYPGELSEAATIHLAVAERDLANYGLTISNNCNILCWWLGQNLGVLAMTKGNLRLGDAGHIASMTSMRCLNVKLSPSKSCTLAAALWESSPQTPTQEALSHSRKLMLTLYCLGESGPVLKYRFPIDGATCRYSFHPGGSMLLVTTEAELIVYDVSKLDAPLLLQQIPLQVVDASMRIGLPKTDQGKASPQSTKETQASEESDHLDLKFSTCGRYIYSPDWDLFALTDDLRQPGKIPDPTRVLHAFRGYSAAMPDPCSAVDPAHPRVMCEDVLYACGQQRFKVFRIHAFAILGWAGDGTNFFDMASTPTDLTTGATPQEGESKTATATRDFTWYRRTLCAIPMNFASWKLWLVWPSRAEQRVFAVMLPVDDKEGTHPTVIYSRDRVEDLRPDASDIDRKEGHLDGWIRSHAGGCAYHIRN